MDRAHDKELQKLVKLGEQIQAAAERLSLEDAALYEHITNRLAKRPKFGKRVAPLRVQLLLFLIAAERLRFIGTHSLPSIVRSFYAVTADKDQAASLDRTWENHPGKHLLSDLQHSLNHAAKRGDPFDVSIAGGSVSIVPRSRLNPTERRAREARASVTHSTSTVEATPATADRDSSGLDERSRGVRTATNDSLLLEFWRPHLMGNRPTLIVFGEPMFVRVDDTFSRNIHRNAEHSLKVTHEKRETCWPFMARGAALCAFHLIRWLTKHQIDVDWLGCRNTDQLHKLTDHRFRERANLVVIGSVRSNGILAGYQQEPIRIQSPDGSGAVTALPYALREDGIVEAQTNRKLGEDQLTQSPYEAWSLVGRRNGIAEGTITMVAANFGQVIARIGEFLTNDELFQGFIDKQAALKRALLETLPSHFQVPIKMSFHDHGAVPGHYEVGEAWFEGESGRASNAVER